MPSDYDVDSILLDDLERAKSRVSHALAAFLIAVSRTGAGARAQSDQAAADHSAAWDYAMAAADRLTEFRRCGIAPERVSSQKECAMTDHRRDICAKSISGGDTGYTLKQAFGPTTSPHP